MIRPTKYLDLNTCVLHIASIVLNELQQIHVISLAELDNRIQDRLGAKARFNFQAALAFLFITGVLDYDLQSDAVYLLK